MLIPILMLITAPETTWWRCRAIVGLTRPLPTASPDQDEDGQWSVIMAIIIFNVKQWWWAAAVGSNQLAQIWWMMIGKATENRWQNKDIMMMTRKICREIAKKIKEPKVEMRQTSLIALKSLSIEIEAPPAPIWKHKGWSWWFVVKNRPAPWWCLGRIR